MEASKDTDNLRDNKNPGKYIQINGKRHLREWINAGNMLHSKTEM